jgi:xanthine dehydrogenase accessory factor
MTRELLAELLRDLEEKRPVVLATELASGAARLIHPFAAGASGDPALLPAAREAAQRDASRIVATPTGEVFLRVFNPPVRVVVIGAVHLAQALVAMVQLAGYDVEVVDPRKAFATTERFAGVPLAREWPDEALARIGLDRRTAVIALTHDPKIDDPGLAAALRSDAFYVGALGSRKTHQARRERLRALGFGDGDLDRIHGPIGLPLGGVSAGEIAVSIAAELVGCLRRAGEEPGTAR